MFLYVRVPRIPGRCQCQRTCSLAPERQLQLSQIRRTRQSQGQCPGLRLLCTASSQPAVGLEHAAVGSCGRALALASGTSCLPCPETTGAYIYNECSCLHDHCEWCNVCTRFGCFLASLYCFLSSLPSSKSFFCFFLWASLSFFAVVSAMWRTAWHFSEGGILFLIVWPQRAS